MDGASPSPSPGRMDVPMGWIEAALWYIDDPAAVHGAPSGRPSSDSSQPPSPSGTSGSRSGRLTCTGPGRPPAPPDAIAQARQARDRQYGTMPGRSSGTPASLNQ